MSYELRDYQTDVVDRLAKAARRAQDDFRDDGTLTAIGCVAPTASGKTVMAAALIERLLDGDDDASPMSDLVVVWVSDQPSLNKQSMEKIESARPSLNHRRLVHLADFDVEMLPAGRVYFAHTQQFGKGAVSYHATIVKGDDVKANDHRTYGLWDMIANTVTADDKQVLLIIDEAHRGVGSEVDQTARKTIISTMIHGGPRGVGGVQPSMPVVLGISATVAKFQEAMARAGKVNDVPRDMKIVAADIEKVRLSGLLKDHLDIPKPAENQEADQTLIAQSVQQLKDVSERWANYHTDTGKPLVVPVMVIQVKPAVPTTELATILKTLEAEWSILKGNAIAHSFDSHADLAVGTGANKRVVRYLEPNAIAEDDQVRAVLFKTALTTGWDCPRAEVMVSMRGSADPTTIAQLIGRMVRTPLAERIEDGDAELNSVYLSLPYYDRKEVAQVVAALKADADTAQGPRVYTVPVIKNPAVPESAWDLLWTIPSAHRSAPAFKTTTARAVALAAELAREPFNQDAKATLDARLVGQMATEYSTAKSEIDSAAEDIMNLSMATDRYSDVGSSYELVSEGAVSQVSVHEGDMDKAYRKAMNALPEDVAANFTRHVVATESLDFFEAQARVIALSRKPGVATAVEKAAQAQIDKWHNAHRKQAGDLPNAARKALLSALWSAPGTLMATETIEPPSKPSVATCTVEKDDQGEARLVDLPLFEKHVVALDSKGMYPVKHGSSWEEDLLNREVESPTLVGWYRNPSSGKSALSVQYMQGGEPALLHPDFLFFHDTDEGLKVDIIDPHQHSSADTGPKWRGLAAYAAQVGEDHDWLRNVYAVIKAPNPNNEVVLRAIDLRDKAVVAALEGVKTKPQVEAVFAQHGFDY